MNNKHSIKGFCETEKYCDGHYRKRFEIIWTLLAAHQTKPTPRCSSYNQYQYMCYSCPKKSRNMKNNVISAFLQDPY